jgi:hypothetical protein
VVCLYLACSALNWFVWGCLQEKKKNVACLGWRSGDNLQGGGRRCYASFLWCTGGFLRQTPLRQHWVLPLLLEQDVSLSINAPSGGGSGIRLSFYLTAI